MKSIIVDNVSKSYGKLPALKNINLTVESGELFCIIGPDGAGKTTLFELLVTLTKPDSGALTIAGYDSVKDYIALRKMIGYMPGKFSLYQDLTVYENLKFYADIFGTSIDDGRELIEDIWSHIEPFKKRKAGKLSGGMKQKLALCCALVHRPDVLFLDEPTTGVDPVSRNEFWAMLKKLKKRGITIFASTPYMDEAMLCDRVSLMQQGEIMRTDTPQNIINSFGKPLFEIKSSSVHSMLSMLREWNMTHSVHAFGQSVHFVPKDRAMTQQDIANYLSSQNMTAVRINQIPATIEDCFMELMTTQCNGNND